MTQFPDEPHIGQVVEAGPEDEPHFIKRISVDIKADECWFSAEAQAIQRVPTSERRYILRGLISRFPVYDGSTIQVTIFDRQVMDYVFVEDCGWTPRTLGAPIIRFQRGGRFTCEPVLTFSVGEFNIHNEVSVDLPPQVKEKEKEDDRT